MVNTQIADTLTENSSRKVSDTIYKEELTTAFDQLTQEEKQQFYEECKNGISPEELRQALRQKIRQLWQQ